MRRLFREQNKNAYLSTVLVDAELDEFPIMIYTSYNSSYSEEIGECLVSLSGH